MAIPPSRKTNRRTIGNLDGESFGLGGTDSVRIQSGSGDFLQAAAQGNNIVVMPADISMENVGSGAGVYESAESDNTVFNFRRITGGDGIEVVEAGDTIVINSQPSNRFTDLLDAPNSFVGHDNKVVVVDEASGRLVFKPQNELSTRFTRVTVSPTPPSEPVVGDGWFHSVTGSFYVYYQGLEIGQWVESAA